MASQATFERIDQFLTDDFLCFHLLYRSALKIIKFSKKFQNLFFFYACHAKSIYVRKTYFKTMDFMLPTQYFIYEYTFVHMFVSSCVCTI